MKREKGPTTAHNEAKRTRAERSVHHTRVSLTSSEPPRPRGRTWLSTATFAVPGFAKAAYSSGLSSMAKVSPSAHKRPARPETELWVDSSSTVNGGRRNSSRKVVSADGA
jgi:hypothetical protein